MMVKRAEVIDAIRAALRRNRIVVLAGPRQCGKTTLAREVLSEESIN
jgi:predicted AAA+ superfamily ATPase